MSRARAPIVAKNNANKPLRYLLSIQPLLSAYNLHRNKYNSRASDIFYHSPFSVIVQNNTLINSHIIKFFEVYWIFYTKNFEVIEYFE